MGRGVDVVVELGKIEVISRHPTVGQRRRARIRQACDDDGRGFRQGFPPYEPLPDEAKSEGRPWPPPRITERKRGNPREVAGHRWFRTWWAGKGANQAGDQVTKYPAPCGLVPRNFYVRPGGSDTAGSPSASGLDLEPSSSPSVAMLRASSLETCIWLTPSCLAISAWVRSSRVPQVDDSLLLRSGRCEQRQQESPGRQQSSKSSSTRRSRSAGSPPEADPSSAAGR